MNCVIKTIKAGIIIFSITRCGERGTRTPAQVITSIDTSFTRMGIALANLEAVYRQLLGRSPDRSELDEFASKLEEFTLRIEEVTREFALPELVPPELTSYGQRAVISFSSSSTSPALTALVDTAEFGREGSQEQVEPRREDENVRVIGLYPLPGYANQGYRNLASLPTRVTRHSVPNMSMAPTPPYPAANASQFQHKVAVITMSSSGSTASLALPQLAGYHQAVPVTGHVPSPFATTDSVPAPATPPYPLQLPHHFNPNQFLPRSSVPAPVTPPYPLQLPHHFNPNQFLPRSSTPAPGDLRREQTIYGTPRRDALRQTGLRANLSPDIGSTGLTPPVGLNFIPQQRASRLSAPPPLTNRR